MCHRDVTTWEVAGYIHHNAACETCHSAETPQGHYPGACNTCHLDDQIWQIRRELLVPIGFGGGLQQSSFTMWQVIDYDHQDARLCEECHLDALVEDHYAGDCAACHTDTVAWDQVTMDHTGLDECQTCHLEEVPQHYAGQCSKLPQRCGLASRLVQSQRILSVSGLPFGRNAVTTLRHCLHTVPHCYRLANEHLSARWGHKAVYSAIYPAYHRATIAVAAICAIRPKAGPSSHSNTTGTRRVRLATNARLVTISDNARNAITSIVGVMRGCRTPASRSVSHAMRIVHLSGTTPVTAANAIATIRQAGMTVSSLNIPTIRIVLPAILRRQDIMTGNAQIATLPQIGMSPASIIRISPIVNRAIHHLQVIMMVNVHSVIRL